MVLKKFSNALKIWDFALNSKLRSAFGKLRVFNKWSDSANIKVKNMLERLFYKVTDNHLALPFKKLRRFSHKMGHCKRLL